MSGLFWPWFRVARQWSGDMIRRHRAHAVALSAWGLLVAGVLASDGGHRDGSTTTRAGNRPEGTPISAHAGDGAALAAQGRRLFLMNCAHCHGDDARGDEGPDLHGVDISDARLANTIKNGIKGKMPRFSAKFSDGDVQALAAYIRSLD